VLEDPGDPVQVTRAAIRVGLVLDQPLAGAERELPLADLGREIGEPDQRVLVVGLVGQRALECLEKAIDLEYARKAPHRETYDCEVSVNYPIHALIGCDNVRFANHLARTINDLFNKDRKRFPREKGWQAEVVHCEGEEPDGSKRPDQPLDIDHPWLRAKNLPGYRLDRSCSRILLVVGMGREGVNNPLCGIFGITSDPPVLFRVNTDGSDFQVLHRFSVIGILFDTPRGVIIDGDTIFGACEGGDSNQTNGVIFRVKTDGSTLEPASASGISPPTIASTPRRSASSPTANSTLP
jgi:hypothetical protein